MSTAIKMVLTDFTRIEGVNGVAIVSKDGFVIESVMPGGNIDPDALAAMITTLAGAAHQLSEELKLGDMDLLIGEYKNNYVLVADMEKAYFVVVADRRAVLGRIRYEIKRQRDRIRAAL